MRISTSLFSQQAVNAITDQQSALAHTQMQMSLQKRVLTPSEDPVASVLIESFKNDISLMARQKQNSETAKGYNDQEDVLLSQVTDASNRIRDLMLSAHNGTLTQSERTGIANEMQTRLDEIMGVANTKNAQGEYVFSGFKTDVQPFTLNAAGGVVYNGDQGQRLINTSSVVTVALNDPGSDVFQNGRNGNGDFTSTATATNTGSGVLAPGSVSNRATYLQDTYTFNFYLNGANQMVFDVNRANAPGPAVNVITGQVYSADSAISFNGISTSITGTPAVGDTFVIAPSTSQDLFTTVQQAIAAVRAPVDNPAQQAQFRQRLDQALSSLDQGMTNIDRVRATVGARSNVIDAELDHNVGLTVQTKTTLSALEDLNVVEAISRLQLQTTALDAAQRSYAQVQNLSLFKYL